MHRLRFEGLLLCVPSIFHWLVGIVVLVLSASVVVDCRKKFFGLKNFRHWMGSVLAGRELFFEGLRFRQKVFL